MLMTVDNFVEIKKIKQKMAEEFEVKELSALEYFLGMEVARRKKSIFVS